MTEKLKFRKFYEVILDFYHWLHRCIEGYMERKDHIPTVISEIGGKQCIGLEKTAAVHFGNR